MCTHVHEEQNTTRADLKELTKFLTQGTTATHVHEKLKRISALKRVNKLIVNEKGTTATQVHEELKRI